jgi:hypothetical protein
MYWHVPLSWVDTGITEKGPEENEKVTTLFCNHAAIVGADFFPRVFYPALSVQPRGG